MAKLTDADYRSLSEFRYTLRRFLAFTESAARGVGLTPQQHQALLAIKGNPDKTPMTVKQLAERLLLQPHSTFELTDRLETAGLITRAPSPSDRRKVLITPTEKAEQLLQSLSDRYQEEYLRVVPELADALSAIVADLRRRASERAKDPGV